MKKSYIQKITPFIDKYRHHRGEEGSQPTSSLIPFKVGDKFIDFHFNTSYTPQKSDFNFVEGDGLISILAAYNWYQHGDVSDIDGDAIAAQWVSADLEIEEGVFLGTDLLLIMNFKGCPFYVSNAEAACKLFGDEFAELITQDGWQVSSFREFATKYELDWDFGEESYGELIAQIPSENDYLPDYEQAANGKICGFKQEDIKA